MNKILIIDDNSANIQILTDILRPDYEIFFARSGSKGLRHLADGLFPDIILLDIRMPEMDGYQVLSRLRQEPEVADIPVIFVTALDDAKHETRGLNMGAVDYITRPFNPAIVRSRIANHLELAQARRESQNRYRTLFTNTADGVIICDLEGRIMEANLAMSRHTGYNREELFGMDYAHICIQAEANQTEQRLTRIRETGSGAFESVQIARNGTECPVEVNAHRIEFSGRPAVLFFFRDISQRKAAEAELQRYREQLEEMVARRTEELREKDQTLIELQHSLNNRRGLRNIIGQTPIAQQLIQRIETLADVGSTVIITGESGAGKELVAENLHYAGVRKNKPFVKIGCSDLSETLIESELFGHIQGAFTGALRARTGKFEAAGQGTVFLDEVGDIPPTFQQRLIRVLEERCFERVGENTPIPMQARIVAATHRDLADLVRRGRFREDLYYRLKVVELRTPPLRERKEDIPLLIRHFLSVINRELNKDIADVSDEVLEIFMHRNWPGNIRELKHVLEWVCINCTGAVITLHDLPEDVMSDQGSPLPETVAHTREARRILDALQQARWNKTRAAQLLNVSRQTLYRKIRDLGIQDEVLD